MRIDLKLPYDYRLKFSNSARWGWSDFKVFRHPEYSHYVWGKFSVILGQPHLEEIEVCDGCFEEVHGLGPDGISFCDGCGCVEGATSCMTIEDYENYHN